MTLSFNFASNPQTTSKPSDEKIAQMKKEQEARRAKLLGAVEEYRDIYAAAEKSYAEAQSIFVKREQELARHEETDKDYEKYEKEYKHAKKAYHTAGSDKDLKLQLLQYRTDNYVKANRINLLDLA